MKKLLLTVLVAAGSFVAKSQVVFSVQSPSNIAGLYQFTNNGDGSGWGLADLLNPAYAVEDTLMFVNDGATGLNAQGHPNSAHSCDSLVNNLTGKIAVIYRNTCTFGEKALHAQNAGARAVIIINREPGLINMAGSVNVTIPVTFISDTDGALLVNAMNSGSVVVFIGNKQNHFANDLGTMAKDVMIAKEFSNPALLSQSATEYAIDLGLKVRNFGTNSQTGATVTATIKHNNALIYNQISPLFNIANGDSAIVQFPQFSQGTYPVGKYTLAYTINNPSSEQDTTDNVYTTDFLISDSLYSLAPLDAVTNLPVTTGGTQPASFVDNYDACIAFQNNNASRVQAEGLYFSGSTNATDSLSGQQIVVSVYEISDIFDDLTTAPASGAVVYLPVTQGFFTYPQGNQANMQREMVYQSFDQIVELEDAKRYMFCAQAASQAVFIGYNTKLSYEKNVDSLLQPLVPVITDGSVNLVGFGGDNVPALAVKMGANTVGLAENNKIEMNAYPNPTKGNLTVTIPENGNGSVRITDVTGKEVMNANVIFANNKTVINTENLEAGMYIVNVIVNSKVAQTTIVKQ